ncbi:response regulator [Fusibacter bizertensis]
MTNIMVVDINATTVYRIKKILEGIPVDIVSATTMYEAINRVGNLQSILDLIIIDVNLGPEDGYELITKLKEINPNLMVIIATSLNTRKSFVRAIRVGANDYILKPFDDDYMKQKLISHIKFIDSAKTLPSTSQKQIDTSIYNSIRKAVRENHELLIGLILVYNKKNPAQPANNVRDIALIKGLYRDIENSLNLEDEVFSYSNNGFVIVLHKKSIHMKTATIELYKEICESYFFNKDIDDFSFEIEFINLPNEIDPRQNALSILAGRIEKNMG